MKINLFKILFIITFLSSAHHAKPMNPYSDFYMDSEEIQHKVGHCGECEKDFFNNNNNCNDDDEKSIQMCSLCYTLFHQECLPTLCRQCFKSGIFKQMTTTFNLQGISQLNVALANARWGWQEKFPCKVIASNIEYILELMTKSRYGKSLFDADVDFAVEQELLTNIYGQKDLMSDFEHKKRALFLAVLLNNKNKIREIVEKESGEEERNRLVNCTDYDESTPLHYAARQGNTEIIKLLRSYGAAIKKNNRNGTPILSILNRNFDFDLKKDLIRAFGLSLAYLQSVQHCDDNNFTIKHLINEQASKQNRN